MTQNRIDWSDPRLTPNIYEDMVSVLINRLHPETERVDGSGGDGGRDVLLPLSTGLEIFELKSFTGRMTKTRRSQVKRSLKNAAAHKPTAWHLVVPIDPTPAEKKWFKGELTKDYPFTCDWLGKTWLDGHIAKYPEISRYYIKGSSDEIVSALRELNREQAALTGGVPDAVERIKALRDRINELDPHYTLTYAVEADGTIRLSMTPRYVGAEKDRPIRANLAFRFPDTEEGRAAETALHDTFSYGTPSTIAADYVTEITLDAPAGLGSLFKGGQLAIGPAQIPPTDVDEIALRAFDGEGRVLAQLPLKIVNRSVGARGGELTLTDMAGTVSAKMRLDVPETRLALNYRFTSPKKSLPCMLLPAVRFLSEAQKEGHAVSVVMMGQAAGPPIPSEGALPSGFDPYAKVVADLDDIQRKAGVYFCVPHSVSEDELDQIAMAVHLFSGETLTIEWSSWKVAFEARHLSGLSELATGEAKRVSITAPYILTLDGEDYPLGHVHRDYKSAKLENWPGNLPTDSPDANVEVKFIPGTDDTVTITLVDSETATNSLSIL